MVREHKFILTCSKEISQLDVAKIKHQECGCLERETPFWICWDCKDLFYEKSNKLSHKCVENRIAVKHPDYEKIKREIYSKIRPEPEEVLLPFSDIDFEALLALPTREDKSSQTEGEKKEDEWEKEKDEIRVKILEVYKVGVESKFDEVLSKLEELLMDI